MSEMIDRVAIAIVNAMEASLPKFTQQHWDDLSIPAKAAYRARARAAIEAMREPTEAMEQAGYAVTVDNEVDVWQSMIQAALK